MTVVEPLSQVGSAVIRTKAKAVRLPLSKADSATMQDLVDTLRQSNLVGIAAPQIGRSTRIFVTEIRKTKFRNEGLDPLRIFINPAICEMSSEYELGYEGCGSVAHSDLFGEVFRAKRVLLEYRDEKLKQRKDWFEGFLARIIQHELDHLDGKVFIDRVCNTLTLKSGNEFAPKK